MSEVRNDVEELKLLDIKDLQPFQGKLKDLSKANYAKLRKQIETLGFSEPIAVWRDKDKNYILNGHQRLRTLQVMAGEGVTVPKIPAVFVRAKDKKEAKRKVLALTSQYGEMTGDGLVEFMTDAGIEWPDVKDNFRFPEIDFKRFESEFFTDLVVEDEVPEPPKVAITKPGDLWELGEHRLLCGDCTRPGDVEKVMDGKLAGVMNTDPPYGIGYVENAKSKGQATGFESIENDQVDGPALQLFLENTIRAAVPCLTENAAFYLWHPMLTQGTFFAAAAAADILIHRQIIWCKPSLVFGRGDYHWQHELCFYGWRKGHRPVFYGTRNQTTIWKVGRENAGGHPTQKPVELFAIPMRNHLKEEEIAFEPFAGSGSQLVAAEQLNRKCYAIEIEPKYCDVIISRWEQLTGGKAKRASGQLGNVERGEASRKRLESKGIHV